MENPIAEKRLLSHIGESYSTPQHWVSLHHHQTWEFSLQVEGATSWKQGRQVCWLTPGALLICPPGLRHAMAEPSKENFRIAYFGCSPRLACPAAGIERKVDRGRFTLLPHARNLIPLVRRANEEAFTKQPHRSLAIRLALQQILIEITRIAEAPPSVLLRPEHTAVMQIKTLISRAPEQPWRLRNLARIAGYSPNYLATVFRQATGQTVHAFINQTRLELARSILLTSDEPITSVAFRLGFSSSQHFARAFRDYFGRTARTLRR